MGLTTDDEWERKARNTPPGMADVSGGALPGVICHQCRFFRWRKGDYFSQTGKHQGMAKPAPCAKYQQFMNMAKSPKVPADSPACKHFEQSSETRQLYRKAYG